MKSGLAILLFLLTGFGAFSQKDYFIYLQTDNSQPFYLLMDGKTYSSSDHGYLILSGLQGQAYQFVIGFPRNAFPEQNFILNIYNKDAGYQLKNFADKGWGLVNYQTSEATMNRNSERGNSMISGTRKTDNFSVLLSNVVNDTSILYESVTPQTAVAQTATVAPQQAAKQADTALASKEQPAAQTASNVTTPTPSTETAVAPVAAGTTAVTTSNNTTTEASKQVADTVAKAAVVAAEPIVATKTDTLAAEKKVISDSAIAKIPAKTDSAVAVFPAKPMLSSVKKISVSSSETALEEVYIDSTNSGVDTIRIATPLTKETAVQAPAAVSVAVAPMTATPTETVKADTTHKKEIADTTAATAKPIAHTAQINNSDCRNTATDADIDKLRVKLLSINDLDEKIATTKKLLKSKCFTVKQLKAISELFGEDESKYQLFETAYPFTLDTYNYSTLEDLLKSDYYRDRFKAMIRR
ncbi:DUF4476 domain-containing protein [Pinibacter aurantiacus]|uniref:DUF4476 domain-containing protein n=1 Tax=Pinibacter aurantiacus TaxID=2851599 RepID=A0A9E2W4H9_9BACT|nr:DUF4476 domain-containing protein [Pinibacter aurantiacus]MBV4359775.1 DUF4476 domain-containing protein [Pinibacter aurantiacus]